MEVEIEDSLLRSPLYREIHAQLEAWVASKCPDHLGAIAEMSKN